MPAEFHDSPAYKRFWSLAAYAAYSEQPSAQPRFISSDVIAAAADIARQEGQPLSFTDAQVVGSMYGHARTMERASAAITFAADQDSIDNTMVSEPPWASAITTQVTVPMWEARAQITYTDPDGLSITAWRTVIIPQVLPDTVGGLRDLMASRFQDMLRTQTTRSPSVGTLSSIGKTYLMSV